MKKYLTIAAVLALAGSTAIAQNVNRTESSAQSKTVTSTDSAGRATSRTTSTSTSVTYETRLQEAYRAAGVSDVEARRLIALDTKVVEARRAKANDRIRTYWQEQSTIVTPAQQEKVRLYLQQHPLTYTDTPDYYVTTWEDPSIVVSPGATTVVPGSTTVVPGSTTYVAPGTATTVVPSAPAATGVRVDTPVGSIGVGATAPAAATPVTVVPVP